MTVQACAEIVARGDPDRFLAIMSAPVPAREALFPIVAYNVEVARAPWVTAEPMIAEIRLQWWREAVEEIGRGDRPRAHEVCQPLADVIRGAGVPVAALDGIAAARRWDAQDHAFEDEGHFREYLEATAGGLAWAAAVALGAGAELEGPVRRAGFAGGLANLFLAVPELEARGKRPLVDGRPEAVAALAREGLGALAELRGTDFGPTIPAMRMQWRAPAILKRAARDPATVKDGRVGGPEIVRKLSLMRRAATGGW